MQQLGEAVAHTVHYQRFKSLRLRVTRAGTVIRAVRRFIGAVKFIRAVRFMRAVSVTRAI